MTDPLEYTPTLIDLQEAANARGELGPLDNSETALREVKRFTSEKAELVETFDLLVHEIKDLSWVADDTIISAKVADARAILAKHKDKT